MVTTSFLRGKIVAYYFYTGRSRLVSGPVNPHNYPPIIDRRDAARQPAVNFLEDLGSENHDTVSRDLGRVPVMW